MAADKLNIRIKNVLRNLMIFVIGKKYDSFT